MHDFFKILEWVKGPAQALFQYFLEKPKLTISIEGRGAGSGFVANNVYAYSFYRILVLHNDAPFPARGIKLLKSFPSSWVLNSEIPTRLEADQRIRINITATVQSDSATLGNQFRNSAMELSKVPPFPKNVFGDVILEFQIENNKGRQFYQYSEINEDGSVNTTLISSTSQTFLALGLIMGIRSLKLLI